MSDFFRSLRGGGPTESAGRPVRGDMVFTNNSFTTPSKQPTGRPRRSGSSTPRERDENSQPPGNTPLKPFRPADLKAPPGMVRKERRPSTGGPPPASLPPQGPSSAAGSRRESLEPAQTAYDNPEALEDACEGSINNIKVMVRIRPLNDRELATSGHECALGLNGTHELLLHDSLRLTASKFTYDVIFGESSQQQDIFQVVGEPLVDNVIRGYNSSIFAYGQTGSGKTHTVLGSIEMASATPSAASSDAGGEDGPGDAPAAQDMRGLAPRTFQRLFDRIDEEQDAQGRGSVQYHCRVSSLEIYNEQIYDLLDPKGESRHLQIREDLKRGPYVERLSEHSIMNAEDAIALMQRGAHNRRIGETKMNRESSRSHSVFTCTVERTSTSEDGMQAVLYSRLNLVDLAGSERQAAAGSSGVHLKEACHINKSLSTLGRVVSHLSEDGAKQLHIPYRDSRLTFLLQDSLGGNAKTTIIANVSPAVCCTGETRSTLEFASRAKRIVNRARVNEDTRGDILALQNENQRLMAELTALRQGDLKPAIAERDALKAALQAAETAQRDAARLAEQEITELRTKLKWTEKCLMETETANAALQSEATDLKSALEVAEATAGSESERMREEAEGRLQDLTAVREAEMAEFTATIEAKERALVSATAALEEERVRLEGLQTERATLASELRAQQAATDNIAIAKKTIETGNTAMAEQLEAEQTARATLRERVEELEGGLAQQEQLTTSLEDKVRQLMEELQTTTAAKDTAISELEAQVQQKDVDRAATERCMAALEADVEAQKDQLGQARAARSAKEAELRNEIKCTARMARAMEEIVRVINWAEQPSGCGGSSAGGGDTTPTASSAALRRLALSRNGSASSPRESCSPRQEAVRES